MRLYIVNFIYVGLVFISSCSTTNRLSKGGFIYTLETGDTVDVIQKQEVIAPGKVTISEKEGSLLIKKAASSNLQLKETGAQNVKKGKVLDQFRQALSKDDLYYPESEVKPQKSLRYSSRYASLTAMTISVKNRFETRDFEADMVEDTFPSTYSIGFNPAFAFGLTQAWNWYTPSKKRLTAEITGGVFYGFGATDINNKTTREPVYMLSRKAFYHSRGVFLNLGVEKFDAGVVFGWDRATGPGSKGWVYQNQPFWGIIIGYDIVKVKS